MRPVVKFKLECICVICYASAGNPSRPEPKPTQPTDNGYRDALPW